MRKSRFTETQIIGMIKGQPPTLKDAGNTAAAQLVRLQVGYIAAVQRDGTCCRGLKAGQHVDKRGLARPVGADQAGDRAGVDGQIHPRQRGQPGKSHGNLVGVQLTHRPAFPVRVMT